MEFLKNIYQFLVNLFSKSQVSLPELISSPQSGPNAFIQNLETAPLKLSLAYKGSLPSGKWAKTVTLPFSGRFVCESHYATTQDVFPNDRQFPKNTTEGIQEHLSRSLEVLKKYDPNVTKSSVYDQSYEQCFTPPENGKAGQGSVGDLKPTVEQECWQGNMMWASGAKPKPGTKFLVEANGKACVIQMGFETGPGEEKFLGGVVPEVHWWLGTNNSSVIKLSYLKDQTIPLGPVLKAAKVVSKMDTVMTDTPWMTIALNEVGQTEVAGSMDNRRIVEYHSATSLKAQDDETAWCSSFACWVLKKAGYQTTNSAWARDFLKYGTKLDSPKYGCIVVYKRGTDSGHVHFYTRQSGDFIYGVGGNQSNSVNISAYSKSNVLGYRWPVKAA